MKRGILALAAAVAVALSLVTTQDARADKLDDIINDGLVRCAVVLDFPPIGYRDENNEPAGFDVVILPHRIGPPLGYGKRRTDDGKEALQA